MFARFLKTLPWKLREPLMPLFVFLGTYLWEIILKRRASQSQKHILIYSSAKTGTSTMLASLQRACPKEWVYRTHTLTKMDALRRSPFRFRVNRWRDLFALPARSQQRALCRCLKAQPLRAQVHIISLIRDPVARDIAAFFEVIDMNPQIKWEGFQNLPIDQQIAQLLPLYLKSAHSASHGFDWFTAEMKPFLELDAYKIPFDKEKGYQIYHGNHPPVLIIKLEKIESVIQEAMWEFMGIPGFKLIASNRAAEKWYGSLYQQFLEQIVLPKSYLDEVYESRFANHFYTSQEIQTFRKRWAR